MSTKLRKRNRHSVMLLVICMTLPLAWAVACNGSKEAAPAPGDPMSKGETVSTSPEAPTATPGTAPTATPGTAPTATPGTAPTATPESASPAPSPRVDKMVMIVVDTLRADRLGCYGFDQPTTPTMDRWSEDGILFERLHAASPWTAPSFGSLFTGVSPTVHGAGGMLAKGSSKGTSLFGVTVGGIRKDLKTLPELMPDEFTNAAIVTNAFVSRELGFHRGFDHFDHKNAGIHRYRTADQVAQNAVKWLDENHDKSFFLLIHFFDPHMKYGPPHKYVEQFAPNKPRRITVPFTDHDAAREGTLKPNQDEKRFIRGLYNGEVRFVDDQLVVIEEAMKRLGLMDDTWILFTSDHGEEQFEHGSFEHGHAYEEEVIRVPLILRAPGGKWRAGQRVKTSVQMVDIPATILSMVDVPIPNVFEGQSLLPVIEGKETTDRTTYSEFNLFNGQSCSLFDGRYKIVWDTRRKRGFYYDLHQDPLEKVRLSSDDDIYRGLFERLTEKRAQITAASKGKISNNAVLSKEATEALEGLGYLKKD